MVAMMSGESREQLLERYGRAYGSLGLAIAVTDGIVGDAAKAITRKGWNTTRPLAAGDFGAGYLARRCESRNPAVVLRASGLIGLDIDGAAGTRLLQSLQLNLPPTIAVRTGGGAHLWYRPPAGAPASFVKVQLAEKVTISKDGYFVCPPARHPKGHIYTFADGHAPWEIEIAVLPLSTVNKIQAAAARARGAAITSATAGETTTAGGRHERLLRLGCAMRRVGGSAEAIEAALFAENEHCCDPPKEERLVRELAHDIFDRYEPTKERNR